MCLMVASHVWRLLYIRMRRLLRRFEGVFQLFEGGFTHEKVAFNYFTVASIVYRWLHRFEGGVTDSKVVSHI